MSANVPMISPVPGDAAGAGATSRAAAAMAADAADDPLADPDAGVYAGRAAVAKGDAAGGGAGGAVAGRGVVLVAASGVMPAGADAAIRVVPHCTQNFAPGWVSKPHVVHFIAVLSVRAPGESHGRAPWLGKC